MPSDINQENLDELDLRFKDFSLDISEFKKQKADDSDDEVGVFWGAMATEDKDRGGDVIKAGAFDASLERYRKAKRPIRLLLQHSWMSPPIGIIPIKSVEKVGKKWNVKGELNLDTQRGRETYALLKQGALSDLSIGFTVSDFDVKKDGGWIINELELWEVSVVTEPANAKAQITEIKSATTLDGDKDKDKAKDLNDFDCMKDVEGFLKAPSPLSSSQRKILISKIKSFSSRDAEEEGETGERDVCSEAIVKLNDYENNEVDKRLSVINNLLKKGD